MLGLGRVWAFGVVALAVVWSPAGAAAREALPADEQERAVGVVAISFQNGQRLQDAFEQLYNLDFDAGLGLFEEAARAERESASVRAFWAAGLLYEILAHQGTLESQLFVTSNEFLKQSRLPVDPELDRRFQAVIREAEEQARRRLKDNPEDADALFALGLVYGNLANYAAGVKGEYFRGLRQGEKSYEYHKRLRALRPDLHDTGVVLGVHDYVLGSLPRSVRFFLFFVGARGSRERGLQYLEEAAREGEFLRTYAQTLLAVTHIREGQAQHAGVLLEELRTRYRRNPIFKLELARLYRRQGRYPQARQVCQELLAELVAHPRTPRILGPEDAWLELGREQAEAGKLDAALESFRQVEQVVAVDKKVLAWALLEQGRIFDQKGERGKALSEYEKVIRLGAERETVHLAHSYKEDRYRARVTSHP